MLKANSVKQSREIKIYVFIYQSIYRLCALRFSVYFKTFHLVWLEFCINKYNFAFCVLYVCDCTICCVIGHFISVIKNIFVPKCLHPRPV